MVASVFFVQQIPSGRGRSVNTLVFTKPPGLEALPLAHTLLAASLSQTLQVPRKLFVDT